MARGTHESRRKKTEASVEAGRVARAARRTERLVELSQQWPDLTVRELEHLAACEVQRPTTYDMERARVAAAVADLPTEEFGLRAFPGHRFRVGPLRSHFVSMGEVQIVVQTWMADRQIWLDFGRNTPEHVRREMVVRPEAEPDGSPLGTRYTLPSDEPEPGPAFATGADREAANRTRRRADRKHRRPDAPGALRTVEAVEADEAAARERLYALYPDLSEAEAEELAAAVRTVKRLSMDHVSDAQGAALDLLAALEVLILTPHVRTYLTNTDPKALAQAVKAVTVAGGRTVIE